MKDQVVMSKANGALGVAIPLYRNHEMDTANYGADKLAYGIKMVVTEPKPIAYVVDVGTACQLCSAEFVEENLEFLGEL